MPFHKQTVLEFARNININLNCKSDLIKNEFLESYKQAVCELVTG